MGTLRLLITAVVTLCVVFCSQEPAVDIAALERSALTEDPAKILAKAGQALAGENTRQAVLLSAVRNPGRQVIRSPSGNSIAWADGRHFFYWYQGRFERLPLPELPLALGLSHSAHFAAIVFRKQTQCVVRVLDLNRKELGSGSIACNCAGRPAISDDGSTLLVPFGKELHRMKRPASGLETPGGDSRIAGPFAAKYPRAGLDIHAFALDTQSLIFVGTGGHYNLYSLREKDQLTAQGSGFTTPHVFVPGTISMLPFPKSKEAAPALVESRRIIGDLLSGGSAQLKLIRLILQRDGFATAGGTPVPFSISYASIPGSGTLLVSDGYARMHPFAKDQPPALPIAMKRFFVFPEGLLYEDPEGRFHLRRSTISELETRLMRLIWKLRAVPER